MEPRVFIGCSSEALSIAEFLQTQLQHVATVQIWNQGFFKGGDYILERLLEGVREFDFAVFIVSPDDLADIRGYKYLIARDNVLFEAGLFFSQLGRKRTLLVAPYKNGTQEIDFHLPSDFTGLTLIKYYTYSTAKDLSAKLGPASTEIKGIIEEQKRLIDSIIEEIIASRAFSGGLLYLLRHLSHKDFHTEYSKTEIVDILLEFNGITPMKLDQLPPDEHISLIAYYRSWRKAADYALQALCALKLSQDNYKSCSITELGKMLLENETTKRRFHKIMNLPLVNMPWLNIRTD